MRDASALHPPPRTAQQQRSRVRQRAVLDAALACFAEQGVERTSIEDICQRSGAGVSSVYHHFGSKAGVAAALYVAVLEDFQQGCAAALAANTDARSWIGCLVASHLAWVDANEAAARFLNEFRHAEWLAPQAAQIRALNARFGAAIADAMRAFVAAGELRAMPPDLFIALLLGPTHEYIRARLAGRTVTPSPAAGGALGEAVWRALAAAAETARIEEKA